MKLRATTRWGLALGGAAGMAAAGVIAASACTSLAQLNVGPGAGPAGSQLDVSGSSFNAVSSGSSPVAIHLGAPDGPVLSTVAPDASGAIGPVRVTIPSDLQPGFYTIVATQTDKSTGKPAFGTPARGSFEVTGTGAFANAQPGSVQPTTTAAAGTSTGLGAGLVVLLAVLGLGGLILFGLGATTLVGSRRAVPVASRVRK